MINQLLSRLSKLKKTKPNQWIACCPVHNDKSPSLGVKHCDNGKIIVHCFAGCSVVDIMESIGLDLSDLFPKDDNRKTRSTRQYFSAETALKCLLKESAILSLASADIENGIKLTHADLQRIKRAGELILDATTYCNQ